MGSVSISLSPLPPTTGQTLTITTSGLPPGHELKLDWNPPGEPVSVEVGEDGKATVTIPEGPTTLIVIDSESETDAATVIRRA